MVATVVFAAGSTPLTEIAWSIAWLALLSLLAFLMVSTWRYWSFKDLNLMRPRSPLILVLMCLVIYGIWFWGQTVLLLLSAFYVSSGIVIRLGGIIRRIGRPKQPPASDPEVQVG